MNMNNVCIIFDFDGTLADTLHYNHKIINQLAKSYNFNEVSFDDLTQLKNKSAKQVLDFLDISFIKYPFVLYRGKKLLNNYISEIPINTELVGLLRDIKGKCQTGVITTNSRKNVSHFFEREFDEMPFDFIYSNARLLSKQKLILKAVKKLKVLSENVLYIGDEIRDIDAARKAGVKIACVTWGYNTKESINLHNPDFIVDSFIELNEIILNFLTK